MSFTMDNSSLVNMLNRAVDMDPATIPSNPSAKMPSSMGMTKSSLSSSSSAVPPMTPSSFVAAAVSKVSPHKAGGANNNNNNKSDVKATTTTKKRSWKKPKDKPKRPLSAYNLFFQSEREKIIGPKSAAASSSSKPRRRREAHGKIGFADLARNISAKWKALEDADKVIFEARADLEKKRYKRELEEWNRNREAKQKLQQQAEAAAAAAAAAGGGTTIPAAVGSSAVVAAPPAAATPSAVVSNAFLPTPVGSSSLIQTPVKKTTTTVKPATPTQPPTAPTTSATPPAATMSSVTPIVTPSSLSLPFDLDESADRALEELGHLDSFDCTLDFDEVDEVLSSNNVGNNLHSADVVDPLHANLDTLVESCFAPDSSLSPDDAVAALSDCIGSFNDFNSDSCLQSLLASSSSSSSPSSPFGVADFEGMDFLNFD